MQTVQEDARGDRRESALPVVEAQAMKKLWAEGFVLGGRGGFHRYAKWQ